METGPPDGVVTKSRRRRTRLRSCQRGTPPWIDAVSFVEAGTTSEHGLLQPLAAVGRGSQNARNLDSSQRKFLVSHSGERDGRRKFVPRRRCTPVGGVA